MNEWEGCLDLDWTDRMQMSMLDWTTCNHLSTRCYSKWILTIRMSLEIRAHVRMQSNTYANAFIFSPRILVTTDYYNTKYYYYFNNQLKNSMRFKCTFSILIIVAVLSIIVFDTTTVKSFHLDNYFSPRARALATRRWSIITITNKINIHWINFLLYSKKITAA